MQFKPEIAPIFEFDPEALTAQAFFNMQNYLDVPKRLCICCDGGLNRSVMAANILNHMANKRSLPVKGEARAAFPNTQGRTVSSQVWDTLEKHEVQPDKSYLAARYLEHFETAHFSEFAGITAGAMERFAWLGLPEQRYAAARRFFYGVRDPEYGEITYEQAFNEIEGRVARYLDAFETECKQYHIGVI